MYVVYILRCADQSLYIGRTGDMAARLREHNEGRGSTYTAARRPVVLAYQEPFDTEAAADRRERQLKRWSTAKKEALVRGDTGSVRRLAMRRIFDRKHH